MSEINFIDQGEKKKPKTGNGNKGGNIRWTDPARENTPDDSGKGAGWFSFLSKNNGKADSNLSRQDALRMIKEYVEVKEKSVKPERSVASAAESATEETVRAKNTQEEPEAVIEQSIFKQKVDAVSQIELKEKAVGSVEKQSWLKKIFTRKKKSESANQGILATDLIKGEIVVVFDWGKNLSYLLFFVLISTLLVAAAYQGIGFWENSKLKQVNSDFSKFGELKNQIKENEKGVETVLILQKKLDSVKTLLDNHIYWTEFFNFLEENTLAEIFFNGFTGDTSGVYKLGGTASDFRTIGDQLRLLKENKLVEKAFTSGGETKADPARPSVGSVSFELDLTVDKNIFYKKNDQ